MYPANDLHFKHAEMSSYIEFVSHVSNPYVLTGHTNLLCKLSLVSFRKHAGFKELHIRKVSSIPIQEYFINFFFNFIFITH